MRTLFLVALLALGCAHADVALKNDGNTVGPVVGLDCVADGGLQCSRASGSSTGSLRCASATNTTPGCVSTTAQVFTGPKTFTGQTVLDGGLMVNGTTFLDGGAYVAGALIVDAGITAKGNVSGSGLTATGGFIFFNIRSDGGVSYFEGDDPSGKIGFGSQGGYFLDGFSVPHSSQLCGYFPGAPLGNRVSVVGQRFAGRAQFIRLSNTVVKTGVPDGGLAADAGATQTWFAEVYNTTTGAQLCWSGNVSCNVSAGYAGSVCAADGGALVSSADDIELRVYSTECLVPPLVNLCAEYNGPP